MKNYKRVFEIFDEISAIPRGSGNMKKIADFCVEFAEKNSLEYIRDASDNVVIFKNGTFSLKNEKPIILQGHLDMVCQQTPDSTHNFEISGPQVIVDGDFLKANNTTLGADNGIAVAMIMAILESEDIVHPPIEAVFTTDEEVGMFGAIALDCTPLKSKRMINLDSEEDDTVTVSCAGGSEFKISVPVNRTQKTGTLVTITLKGLKGGHSGVEIDKGRVNANILAGRILNHLNINNDFEIVSINGGDKSNAITPICAIQLVTSNSEKFFEDVNEYFNIIKSEISAREPDFSPTIDIGEIGEYDTIGRELTDKLIYFLLNAPNGIVEMSSEIKGLVQTSLNLGILKTIDNEIIANFSLRSNKVSALNFLEERLKTYVKCIGGNCETFGHYPPWEFKNNSQLQNSYIECYKNFYNNEPKVEAIHAGLECGVFCSKIDKLDCIAIGPSMFEVHTVNEKLSISSTENFFKLLLNLLEKI